MGISNSQMVGFLADYESGEITLQESEIHDAQWFSYDQPLRNYRQRVLSLAN